MRQTIFLACFCVLTIVLTLPLLTSAAVPPHPEFSADMISTNPKGKVFAEGKLYVGKTLGRIDVTIGKHPQTQFFRFDSDKVTSCMPENKSCIEMKLNFNTFMHQDWKGWSEDCIGNETIDGHPCKVCKREGRFMGRDVKVTVSQAQDLQGIIIRTVDDGGGKTELKNIVAGPQSPSLFELPAGYQKIAVPVNMGDIFKGLLPQKP